ncbi:hypothetical protein OEV98_01325 [Caldibacillus lycopersici]|uniref:Uncharacterized protein n=1 Tax=Perspicuibacillus lycopersici TaxID=1325689 RepID=A0AAE3IPH6_9BACI|nr:hypothetical protein [Perspicuibacillus lycopersici]MCU9612200.1 hypothetical protein [Perspicuibacillus lycopersici]
MNITYKDVHHLFSDTKGYKNDNIAFETMSFGVYEEQPKGLFIPLEGQEDLQQAIYQGAIAAIWEKSKSLPKYIPNDFPIFFVSNINSAALQLIEQFVMNQSNITTNFLVYEKYGDTKKTVIYSPKDNRQQLIVLMDAWKGRE